MADPIDFYFDFGSPYGYFASHLIDSIAANHHRTVDWHPIMVGAAFKESGNRPLVEQPLKGDYARRDWERTARLFGIPWKMPEEFPIAALAASRVFYCLHDRDHTLAKLYARAIFNAHFGEGRDIRPPETVADIAAPLGVDRETLLQAVQDPEVKQRLRTETDLAIARGVFGSPFFFVDGEPFWGCDRLPMVMDWLEKGGW